MNISYTGKKKKGFDESLVHQGLKGVPNIMLSTTVKPSSHDSTNTEATQRTWSAWEEHLAKHQMLNQTSAQNINQKHVFFEECLKCFYS